MPKQTNCGNFKPIRAEAPYRLIWRSEGPEKTGKNYLGLGAPGPIAVQCFDVLGLEGTAEKFIVQGKDIKICKYRFSKTDDDAQDQAKAICDRFEADFENAMTWARTIQWDETELWNVYRYAQFGAASDAPKNYDKLNFDYASLIHRIDETDINFQLIQKVKEKWITVEETDRNGKKVSRGKPSGEDGPVGFKELKYIVQANLKHSWDKERGFIIDVVNCRQNMGIAGEQFENLSFPELAMLVFPESSEEDWQ